jgi:hypothetical protein
LANPVKLKLPDPSAVTVALAVPLNVTVAALPLLIVPKILQLIAVAVKFTAVALAPLIVTARFTGLKVKPVLLGVTVYEPLARPVKV